MLLLYFLPFIFFFFSYKINYYYFLKFLLLNIIAFIYNFFYSILYIIYFIFKNFRFYSYNGYGTNFKANKFFYNKKSIYFYFWKYLTIYVITYIYQVFLVFIFSIYLNLKNIYFFNIILYNLNIILKAKFLIIYKKPILSKVYRLIVTFYYHIFKFINLDFMFFLLKRFNIFKKLKYIEDPILYRNSYIKLSFINFLFYNILVYKKFLINIKFYFSIYLKKKILIHLINLIYYLNLFVFVKMSQLQEFLWGILFINLKKKKIKFLTFYVIYIFFLNILYILLSFIMLLINIIIYNIYKYKYILLYILLFILCMKYYWLIYYYFILLFKHYILYLPFLEVKEASRFFNFEWIDLRNYYNLMLLHNNLIDLTYLNNIIYNDMLVYLNNILSLYGFKITTQYNIRLNSFFVYLNNDTVLLNNLLNVYNNSWHGELVMRYEDIARFYVNKFKMTFKTIKAEEEFYPRPFKHILEGKYKQLQKTVNIDYLHSYFFTVPIEYQKNYKENVRLWLFYNKEYNVSNLLTNGTVILLSSRILKLKKIPLRYIYFYYENTYFTYVFNNLKRTHELYVRYKFLLGVQRKIGYFFSFLKKKVIKLNYTFFFSTVYNYKIYKNLFHYKYKIPNLNWSLIRRKKRTKSNYLIDYIFMNGGAVSETHPVESYQDTAIKKLFKKRVYNYIYIYEFYPYNINNNKNIIKCFSYFDIINKNLKIIKKYQFINNNKMYQYKRRYTILLENYKWLTDLIKIKLSKLKVHFKYFFNKKKKRKKFNFWFFFENIKVSKYTQNEDSEVFINLFFVKSSRKTYIKYRNTLLRFIGLYNYHYLIEYIQLKSYWPEFTAYLQNRYLQYNFENLKLNWNYKNYLTLTRKNGKALKSFRSLIYLFKKNFILYYIMCDYTINSYNDIFNNKVEVYKLQTLNKINNLKRFFFFKSKKNFGWAIFNYLNCFSLKFHLKHLLWHSPYSFLFYKNEYLLNIDDLYNIKNKEIKYCLKYIYINNYKEKQYINLIKYSFVFNLFINIANIKSAWYKLFIIDKIVLNNTLFIENSFISYFINFYNFSYLELYRILISLIFSYYNNFIYRIERFGYILKYKNYTILTFLKRYFNVYIYYFLRNISIKIRWQVYRYTYFSCFFKRHYAQWFSLYSFYKARIKCLNFMPLWFYYDFYVKAFIYFLLKKYYVKSFFVIYWLYIKFSYKFILNLIIIYYYIFFYNVLNKINFIKINFIIMSWYLLNLFYIYLYTWYDYNLKFLKYEYRIQSLIYKITVYIQMYLYIEKQKFLYYWFNLVIYYTIKSYIENTIFYLFYLTDLIVQYIYKTVDFVINSKIYLKLITHIIYIICVINFYLKYKFKVMYYNSKQFIFDLFIDIAFFLHLILLYIYFYIIKNIIIDLNWYLKIILQIYIFFIDPIKFVVLFKCYIYIFLINLNFINNLNNWLLIKIYFFKYFFNYIKLLLNIKNTLIYFKSNYYLFRKQRYSWGNEDTILYKTVLVNTVTIRNIKFFKHFTHNIVFLKNIYLFNFTNYLYLINKVNINMQFLPLIQIIKYNFVYYYIIIYIYIYLLFILFFFIYYKKFYNFLFFCKKVEMDAQLYWKNYFDKKSIDLSKHYWNKKNKFRKKIWKWRNWFSFYNFIILNSLKTTYIKKNLIKIFFLSKFYNNFRKLFNINKLVSFNKKIFMSYNFFFNKYFDFVKNISMVPVPIKKEKKKYMFFFLNSININLLNFCFFYWFIVIPYFFFEYVWIRFKMRGHIRLKRKYIILLKVFFDNFKLYVRIFKVIGNYGYFQYKRKIPKSYINSYAHKKKKRLRFGGYFKLDRYQQFFIRLLPMGNYYYWFKKINQYHYYFYTNIQILNIFNMAFKSFYFFIINIYIFFLIIFLRLCKIHNYYKWHILQSKD